MLVVLTLNFFLFQPKFVTCFAFDKAVKLGTIGFTSGMTADLARVKCLLVCVKIIIFYYCSNEIFYAMET
jgi:hypothetical protein